MAGICEGRSVIVTGAGRGIGREHALEFARQGARVVVNDLGGAVDGTGSSQSPAQDVVDEIRKAGGEAIANADNVCDFNAAGHLVESAIEAFRL
jgi:NAD(P)-dependent dehydrogenase (short-subunit alcohol dehydrogenase family)